MTQSEIDQIQNTIPENLKSIPGTRSIHQVVTNCYGHIKYRPLSCFRAANDWYVGDLCNCHLPSQSHNYTGPDKVNELTGSTSKKPLTKKKLVYKHIYSSSDEETESVQYMESDDEEIYIDDMITSSDPNHDTNLPILETPTSINVRQGTYVLVKIFGGARKKTNYQ